MAGGRARRAAGCVAGAALAAALAALAPGGAQGRTAFNDRNVTKIDSSRFFRDVISSDETWMVAFISGQESDLKFLANVYEGIEEIISEGHGNRYIPKVGVVQLNEDIDRVVTTKLGLMEELPTLQGFHVKKDKDAMVELADSTFGEDSADIRTDFIQYYEEWEKEWPPVGEDGVVMKVNKVDTGNKGEL